MASRAAVLLVLAAIIAAAAGCAGAPADGAREGEARPPPAFVLERIDALASGPARLDVSVVAGGGGDGSARDGRVLLAHGRARVVLPGNDDGAGTIDVAAETTWVARFTGAALPPEAWLFALAVALRPADVGPDHVSGGDGAPSVLIYRDGRLRGEVTLAADDLHPEAVVVGDAAGRPTFRVALAGPWRETAAGRFPSEAAIQRMSAGLPPDAWGEPVRVVIVAVTPLAAEPDEGAFRPGAPLP